MPTNNKLLMIQNGFVYRYVDGEYTGEKAELDPTADVSYNELQSALNDFRLNGLPKEPDAA